MDRSTHPVEQEEVMAYLDGELPADRAAGVAAHMEECVECQALATELRGVSQQLTAWQVEPSPERLAEGVTAALEEHGQKPATSGRARIMFGELVRDRPLVRRWIWGLGATSAVAGLIFAVWVINKLRAPLPQLEENRTITQVEINPQSGSLGRLQTERGAGGGGDQKLMLQRRMEARSRSTTRTVPGPSPTAGPMIARTATLVIVAKDFDALRATVERIVSQHQGYIAELTTNSPKEAARTLAATLRIPAPQLNAALAELKALGRVEQETQAGEEVTKQYTDLVARLKNSRATEQRLVDILRQRPGKVSEVLEVEQEIARVRGEIEQMEADRKSLETRVQFATVKLQVSEEYKAQLQVTPPSTGTRLRNALVGGYRDAAESAIGFVLFLLGTGPTLLLWLAVLYWPARFAWRRWRAAHPAG